MTSLAVGLIVPVILAGGSGTRLWPVSRESLPKQFQHLVGDLSTYQQTLNRVADRSRFADPVVVTHDELRFFAERQGTEIGAMSTVLIEPERRDSAAALTAAVVYVEAHYGESLVLALAADHIVNDEAAFMEAVAAGRGSATDGAIVTFGIAPTESATGYGYIRPGAPVGANGVLAVAEFIEKPSAAEAARYIAEGCLWNSGNFLFSTNTFLKELERFAPEIVSGARGAVAQARTDLAFVRLDPERFRAAPRISIDYALMEKTTLAAVVRGRFGWSDVGSWDAILKLSDTDEAGNSVEGPVVTVDTHNSLLRSDGPVVGAIGVDGLVVVVTADAVLVADRTKTDEVKTLVEKLRETNVRQATQHRMILRPWGAYESIDRGDRFHVKRIVVDPGGRLSLQKHMHRAEHWVVVRGTAEVTIDDGVRMIAENQSVYIPLGAAHRLANPGKIPLELIEVQTGSYLEEDDIIRLEDIYWRV